MPEYTFSKFIYFDTNIVSHFAKNPQQISVLFDYLKDHDLTTGIGGGQVAELADVKSLHLDLARFFVSVPTGLLKNWDEIIAEEVKAHPKSRSDTLLMYGLNAVLLEENGLEKLIQFLDSDSLAEARSDQKLHAKQMRGRIIGLKSNFPPSKSGKYTRKQADEFAMLLVMQWLTHDHRDFLKRMQKDITKFRHEVFMSIRLFAYVLFYKYYLGQREPKRLSDFGDFFHLFHIPYCEIAVMERDLCNILNQIKKNHDILDSTQIYNIDFLQQFS